MAPALALPSMREDFSLTSGTLFAFHKLPLADLSRGHRDFHQ